MSCWLRPRSPTITTMGHTKASILELLQQLGVKCACHEHAPVMTSEAQAAALAGMPGAVTKNLFLKDKKRRQYLITALADTKVDYKVLSARLGLGKGGLQQGSEELLVEALQVEPGCVTPLALANPSAAHCLLLLDAKLAALGDAGLWVHPIVNSASLALSPAQLEAFLKGIGRQPIYVDLEADPKIDKDNPPDLKQYADSIEPPPKAEGEEGPASSSAANNAAAAASKAAPAAAAKAAPAAAAAGGKASKQGGSTSKGSSKAAAPSSAEVHIRLSDAVQRTDHLINLVAAAVLGKPLAEAGVDPYLLSRLRADVQMELTSFKNAAYTLGYTSAKEEVVAYATKRYA